MFRDRNYPLLLLFSSFLVISSANSIITNEKEQGKGIMLENGKDRTLMCNDTSTVSTEITWYKDGIMINATEHKVSILPENGTLVIHDSNIKDAGKYTCVSDQSNNYTINVYAKIHIEQFPKSLNLVQGDTLNLHCEVKGYPLPRITWYKDDELVNATDERVELMADKSNISNAKLVIKDLDYDDRAVYMCLAENGISDPFNATVLVRVKDKLAALWPFLGICAEVAILCAIIFIYEKKRVKPDFDESDTDQIPESKNVADKDKVPDVRQRK